METTVTSGMMDQDTVNKLTAHIEKIERLEEEKTAIGEAVKDEFTMAKSFGFDPKVMKIILKLRKRDDDDIQEEEQLLDTYRHALGMI